MPHITDHSQSSTGTMDTEKAVSLQFIEYADHDRLTNPNEILQLHKDYLIERHGTYELKPLPSSDPRDPLNWSDKKKAYHIMMVSLLMFACTFLSAGISPGYLTMAAMYGKTTAECSYLTTVQIGIMGVMPLLWVPLMEIYGRKPLLILALLGCVASNIGGVYCTTYAQQIGTRAVCAVFLSAGGTLGGAFTGAMCFDFERGRKNGIWSLANIVGTPGGPILMGFVNQHAGLKWVFWTFAAFNLAQAIGWAFSDETVYKPRSKSQRTPLTGFSRFFHISKLEERNLKVKDVVAPFKHAANFRILLAAIAGSLSFAYANIVYIVEMPSIFTPLFHLDSQGLALQYIPMVIGSLIGEIFAGPLSDKWMIARTLKRGFRHPADRLVFSYGGYLLMILGLLLWGIFLYHATEGVWNIKPLIGLGISSAGADILSTVFTAYAIDCHPTDATNVALFVMFLRLIFGFISPFYFPKMFDTLNYAGSVGLMSGILFGSAIAIMVLHITEIKKTPSIIL